MGDPGAAPAVEAGLDRGWLAALIPAGGYLADFLNPTPGPPRSPNSTVSWRRSGSSPEQVRDRSRHPRRRKDLARSARLRLLDEAPEAALEKVTEEIEIYWELALAAYWARIRHLLEADVFHRARQVASTVPRTSSNELHPA